MVRKVFGSGENKEARIESALKKFFFPENLDVDTKVVASLPQVSPQAGDAKHPEPGPAGKS